MAANAQERLQGASDFTNDRDLKAEAREVIDEVFDDDGDREVFEEKINALVDEVTDFRFADTLVGMALDSITDAYNRTAPQDK